VAPRRAAQPPAGLHPELGWLDKDVWLAHCVHLSDEAVRRLGETVTGVAHCPSSNARLGAGIARSADRLAAGSPAGLVVDGAASQETGENSGRSCAKRCTRRACGVGRPP